MLKRLTSIMIALFTIICLTSCNQNEVNTNKENSSTNEIVNKEENKEESEDKEKRKEVSLTPFDTSGTIENTILIDENGIKVTAVDLKYTNSTAELNLSIENNSDKNLKFLSGCVGYSCNAINGYMVGDGYMNAEVTPGNKANETVKFSTDELRIYGITKIADIQLGIEVSDDDNNNIYKAPCQIKTSISDAYDYNSDLYKQSINDGVLESAYNCSIDYFKEDELYNSNDIKIVSEALITNKDGDKAILMEIENHSSDVVYASISDITIDGLEVSSGTWSSDSIIPGTRRIVDISKSSILDQACWDKLGISDIGSFVCAFSIKDKEYNEIVTPQEISFNISSKDIKLDTKGEEVFNENDIRIISKGIVEDSSEYSDSIHMLLLVENKNADKIFIRDVGDSLSINGIMIDCIVYSKGVSTGKYAIVDVQIDKSDLSDNSIVLEDIKNAQISFEIKDSNYKTILQPKLSITY